MHILRLLTGAPTKDTVGSSSGKFVDTFLPAFCRYLEEYSPYPSEVEQRQDDDPSEVSRSSTDYASFRLSKWRLVPLKHLHQRTSKTAMGPTAQPSIITHVICMNGRDLETSQTLEFLTHSYCTYSQSESDQIDGIDESKSAETVSFSTQDLTEVLMNASSVGYGMPSVFEI